jgi:prophage regulatory protein
MKANDDNLAAQRLLRWHEVAPLVGFTRVWIYQLMKKNEFPKPLKLGSRAIAWRAVDVKAWVDSRPSA